MSRPDFVLCMVKLVLGGIAACLAVILWGRTRDAAWTSFAGGTVMLYAGLVYDLLQELGLLVPPDVAVAGVPLVPLLFAAVPPLFFVLAFIILLRRSL